MKSLKFTLAAMLAIALVFTSVSPSRAAVKFWDGGGAATNYWDFVTNWVGDTAVAAGDDLVFGVVAKQLSTNNLAAGFNVGSFTFTNSGWNLVQSGAVNWITLTRGVTNLAATGTGNTNAIATTLGAAQSWITASSGASFVQSGVLTNGGFALTLVGPGTNHITGQIAGAGRLFQAGTGVMALDTGVNTGFTGGVTIYTGGVANVGNGVNAAFNSNLLGSGSLSNINGTVVYRPGSTGTHYVFTNAVALSNGIMIVEDGNIHLSNSIALQGGTSTLRAKYDTKAMYVDSSISGGGSLILALEAGGSAVSQIYLNRTNSYTGGTVISNAIQVYVNTNSAFGTGLVTVQDGSGAKLVFNNVVSTAGVGRIRLGSGAQAVVAMGALDQTFLNTFAGNSGAGIIAIGTNTANALNFATISPTNSLFLGAASNSWVSGAITPAGGAYRFGGGGGLLTVSNNLTGATRVIAGPIAGSLVRLSGNNTFSDGLVVSNGMVYLDNVNASGTGIIEIRTGAGVEADYAADQALVSRVLPSSAGALMLGADTASGLDLATPGLRSLFIGAGSNVTMSGSITPAAGMYRLGGGPGTLTLTSQLTGNNGLIVGTPAGATATRVVLKGSTANTFTGDTIVTNYNGVGAILVLSNAAGQNAISGNLRIAAGAGAGNPVVELGADEQIADTANVIMTRAGTGYPYLKLLGHRETVATITNLDGAGVIENAEGESAYGSTVGTLVVAGDQDSFFNGYFRDIGGTGGSGKIQLVKTGAGRLVLSGTQIAITGGVTVANGVLQLGDGGANVSLGAPPLTNNASVVYYSSGNLTMNGKVSGNGTFYKAGSGSMILNNSANDMSGQVVISNAVVEINTVGALGTAAVRMVLASNGANPGLAYTTGNADAAMLAKVTPDSVGSVLLRASGAGAINMNAAGLTNVSVGAYGGNYTFNAGNLTPFGDASAPYLLGGGNQFLYGVYGGNYGLTVTNLQGSRSVVVGMPGGVYIAGINGYSGDTIVSNRAALMMTADALGNSPRVVVDAGILRGITNTAGASSTYLITSNRALHVANGGALFYMWSGVSGTVASAVSATGRVDTGDSGMLAFSGTNVTLLGGANITGLNGLRIGFDYVRNVPTPTIFSASGGTITNTIGAFDFYSLSNGIVTAPIYNTGTMRHYAAGELELAGVITGTGNIQAQSGGTGGINISGTANTFTGYLSALGTNKLRVASVNDQASSIGTIVNPVGPTYIELKDRGTLEYYGAGTGSTFRIVYSDSANSSPTVNVSQATGYLEFTRNWAGIASGVAAKTGPGTLELSGDYDNANLRLNVMEGLVIMAKDVPYVRSVAQLAGIAPGATVRLAGDGFDQIWGGAGVTGITNLNGTLDMNGTIESISRLNGAGIITNTGGRDAVLTVGENNEVGNFAGVIADGVSAEMALTKIGSGQLVLSGANTFTGGLNANGGFVLATNSASALGAGLINVNGGTVQVATALSSGTIRLNGGVLQYLWTGTATPNSLTIPFGMNAQAAYPMDQAFVDQATAASRGAVALAANSASNLDFSGKADLRFGAAGNFTYSGTLTPAGTKYMLGGGGGNLTVASALTGANDLEVGLGGVGSGSVILTASNTYSGATTVKNGTLVIGGSAGTLGQGAVTVSSTAPLAASVLTLDNTGVATVPNRLPQTNNVTLNAGVLNLLGSGSVGGHTDQRIGVLTGTGFSAVQVQPAPSARTVLRADSLALGGTGAMLFYGNSLGLQAPATNTGNIFFNTAPTLFGGGTGVGQQQKILPNAIGIQGANVGVATFVTYDSSRGVVPISTNATDYLLTSTFAGANSNINVMLNNNAVLPAGLTEVNALLNNVWDLTNSAASSTLKVNSGAVLFYGTTAGRSYAFGTTTTNLMTLDFNGQTGYLSLLGAQNFYTQAGGRDYIINAQLSNIGAGGLVVNGLNGSLFRFTTTNYAPTMTVNGLDLNLGAGATMGQPFGVIFNDDTQLGQAGAAVTLNNAALILRETDMSALDSNSVALTVSRQMNVLGAHAGLGASTNDLLTWAGKVTGAGAFNKTGPGTVVLNNAANDYAGGTVVWEGRLLADDPNALGTGRITMLGAGNSALGVSFAADQALLNRFEPISTGVLALAVNSGNALNFESANLPFMWLGAYSNATYSGNLTPAAGAYRLTGGSNATLTVSSALGGAAGLIVDARGNSGGMVVLNGTSTFGGGTLVTAGSRLQLGDGTTAGVVQGLITNAGTLFFNNPSGITNLNTITGNGLTKLDAGTTYFGGAYAGGTISNAAGSIFMTKDAEFTSNFGLASNTAMTIERESLLVYAGSIAGPSATVTKTGSGTLVLNGANTFSGGLTINGGTVMAVGNNSQNRLAAGSMVTINNSGRYYFGEVNATPTAQNAVNFTVNQGGTLFFSNYNGTAGMHAHVGNILLNGGVVEGRVSNGPTGGEDFRLNGDVIVSGSAPSVINLLNGIGLAGSTPVTGAATYRVFNVANVTGDSAADLTVNGEIEEADVASAGLVKMGAGTMLVTSNATYTSFTTISNGILKLGAGATITNSPVVTLGAGAALDVSSWTAPGYRFTGNQTLQGAGTVVGSVTTMNGTRLVPGGTNGMGTLTFANDLTLDLNTTNVFDLGSLQGVGGGTNDLVVVGGILAPNGSRILVNQLQPLTAGTYGLFNYGTKSGTFDPFVQGNQTRLTWALDESGTPNMVNLNVTGNGASLVWRGGGATTEWDFINTNSWLNTGTAAPDRFMQLDDVLFDETGASNGMVYLVQSVQPNSIRVSGASNYFFSGNGGKITGATGILKDGTGMLTLGTNLVNDFTGDVVISNGFVKIGDPWSLGSTVGVTRVVGGTLDLGAVSPGYEMVRVQGAGYNGTGAVINTGGNLPWLRRIELTGDTVFGGSSRWDNRSAVVGTNEAILSTGGNAYNLTIRMGSGVNAVEMCLVNSTVDPALANVTVERGLFRLETGTLGLGNPLNTLTVQPGATFDMYQLQNPLNKSVVMEAGSRFGTTQASGVITQNVVVGSMQLNGWVTNNVNVGWVTLAGAVQGAGGLLKVGGGTNILTGVNTWTGGTRIEGGTLQVGAGGTTGDLGYGPVTNFAALNFDRSDYFYVTNSIYGTNSITYNGTNSFRLGQVLLTGYPVAGVGLQFGMVANTKPTMYVMDGDSVVVPGVLVGQVGSGRMGDILQSGGVLSAYSTNDTEGPIRFGHWPGGTSTWYMSGGYLLVTNPSVNSRLYLGIDGMGILNVAGGTAQVYGVAVNGRNNTGGGELNISNGMFSVGSLGITGNNLTNMIRFVGGTLQSYSNSFIQAGLTNTLLGTPSTFTIDTMDKQFTNFAVNVGPGGFRKTGSGTLLMSGTNSFAGDVVVEAGTLLANAQYNVANPTVSALGNTMTNRTITVGAGGTLLFGANDVIGNGASTQQMALVIAGVVSNNGNFYNNLGPVYLAGGTLAGQGGASATYSTYSLSRGLSVTGTTLSAIAIDGSNAGINLAPNVAGITSTTFAVEDVTGNIADDLWVNAILRDKAAGAGAASLIKTGAGTMVLNYTNTYTGGTFVNQGTLALGSYGSISNSPVIAVSTGATLAVGGLAAGFRVEPGQTLTGGGTVDGAATVAVGGQINPGTVGTAGTLTFTDNLTMSNGGTNTFDLGSTTGIGGGTNDYIVVMNDLKPGGSLTRINAMAPLANGDYTLYFYGNNLNLVGGGFGAVIGNATRKAFAIDTISQPNYVLLNVSGASADLVWRGLANSTWDNGTTNWVNTGSLADDRFYDLDSVTFDDTGATSTPVNISGVVAPASIIVNSDSNYTFSGSGTIAGSGGITKMGAGILTLSTSNSFTGLVLVSNGIVKANNSYAFGSADGATIVTNGGTVDVNGQMMITQGETFVISGTGFNNTGALINATAQNNAIRNLTLAGDALIRTDARTDARGVNGAGEVNLGGFALTKIGAGYFVVVDNTMTNPGSIYVNEGILGLARGTVAGAGDIAVGPGATLAFMTFNSGSMTKSVVMTNANLRLETGTTIPIGSTFAIEGSNLVDMANALTLNLTNAISGGGSLTTTNTGTLALGANNSFGGGVNIFRGPDSQTAGAIRLDNYGGLGTGTLTLMAPSNRVTALHITAQAGTGTLANAIALVDSGVGVTNRLTATSGVLATLSGAISGGGVNSVLLLDNDASGGTGAFKLSNAANSFTVGNIRVDRGALVVGDDAALGNGNNPITLAIGANTVGTGLIFDNDVTLGAGRGLYLVGSGRVDVRDRNVVINGPVTNASGTWLYKQGTGSLTINGNISGAGGVSVEEGPVTLAGANSYTGHTIVANGGTLIVDTIADSGTSRIGPYNGVANVNYLSLMDGALRFTGTTTNSTARTIWMDRGLGTFDIADPNGVLVLSPISGTQNKAFTKTGAGTLILGAGTWSGPLTIMQGKVVIGTNSVNGAFTGNVTNWGELVWNVTTQFNYTATMAGTGTLRTVNSTFNPAGLSLSGNNSAFTGPIYVDGGRLAVNSQTAIGAGPLIAVGNGGQVYFTGGTATQRLYIAGVGPGENSGTLGALRLQGSATWAGDITLTGDARVTAYGGPGFITGNIDGNYEMEVWSNNVVTLTPRTTNTYASTKVNGAAATLALGKDNALSVGPLTLISNGTVRLNGFTQTVARLTGATNTFVNNSSATSVGLLIAGTDGTDSIFDGSFSNGAAAAMSFTKAGAGVMTLTGPSQHSGDTRIAGGTLIAANANALSNSTVNLDPADAGALVFSNGTTFTIGGLAGSRDMGLTNGDGTAIALLAGLNNVSTIYGGVLSGPGSFTKVGLTSVLTMTNASTYTGGTTIRNGTLKLANAAGDAVQGNVVIGNGTTNSVLMLGASEQVQDTAILTMNSGAMGGTSGKLQMMGFSETIAGLLTTNGNAFSVIQVAETEVVDQDSILTVNGAADSIYNGYMRNKSGGLGIGRLGLTKDGAGTLTLISGNIGYTGPTTVNNGGLSLSNTTAFVSPIVVNGGRVTLLTQTAAQNAQIRTDVAGGLLFSAFTNVYTIAGLSGSGDIGLTNGAGQATTLTVQPAYATNGVYTGLLSGGGGLIKLGAGSLTLTASNQFTGGLTLGGGSLYLSGGSLRVPAANLLAVTGSSLLDLGGGSQTFSGMTNGLAANSTMDFVATNGTLTINPAAAILLNSTNTNTRSAYDFSGLSAFTLNAAGKFVGLASMNGLAHPGGVITSEVTLSRSMNTISASELCVAGLYSAGTLANYQYEAALHLGGSNIINIGSLRVSDARSRGVLDFAGGLAAGAGLRMRGAGGGDADYVGNWYVGYGGPGTASLTQNGNVILTNGYFDGRVSTIMIGQQIANGSQSFGQLAMGNGLLMATNITLGSIGVNSFVGAAATGMLTLVNGEIDTVNLIVGDNFASSNTSVAGIVNLNNGGVLKAQSIRGGADSISGTVARTFNWYDGTIRNYSGTTDLTITNIPTINVAGSGSHMLSVDGGRSANVYAALTNGGALTKSGAGTAKLLSSANAGFHGTVVVQDGTLQIGDGTTAGKQTLFSVSNEATVVINRNTNTMMGALHGAGLVRVDAGTLTTVGGGTFSGNVRVAAGAKAELLLTNGLGTGTVQLDGGTLLLNPAPQTVAGFGTTGTGWKLNGTAGVTNDEMTVTMPVASTVGSAFYSQRLSLNAFTNSFTYNATLGGPSTLGDGLTVVFQNDARGPGAMSTASGSAMGYGQAGAIQDSAAWAIQLYPNNTQGVSRAVWTNGYQFGGYVTTTPVVVYNQPVDVKLMYDGSSLTAVLTQGASAYTNRYLNVDLPAIVGGDVGFVGFAGATGGQYAKQTVSNFVFAAASDVGRNYSAAVEALEAQTGTINLMTRSGASDFAMQALTIRSNAILAVAADAAATANQAYRLAFSGGTLYGTGTVNVANNGLGEGRVRLGAMSGNHLFKDGAGVLELAGANTYTGITRVMAGVVELTGSGSIASSSTLQIDSGAKFVATNVTATMHLANGQTLKGSGVFQGGLIADSGSTVAPGMSTSILTVDGDWSLTSGSIFDIELNGLTAGTEYDQLVFNNNTLTLVNPTLNVTLGFAPALSNSWTIVSGLGGAAVGSFSGLPDGAQFTKNYSGTDYTLKIKYNSVSGGDANNDITLTVVPEPAVIGLLGLGIMALAFRRRSGRAN